MKVIFLAVIGVLMLVFGAKSSAATVPALYNAVTDIPVTAGSYTATGNTVDFTLNFAPATGTALTVVNNTGTGFIQGTFGNLTHGQIVPLTYGGVTYKFVANYYGGTGNDLMLQWAVTRAIAWGANTYGQLGNNSTTYSKVPVAVNRTFGVSALSGKTLLAVAGGGRHNLALCSDGTVAAWGQNSFGELGNNSPIDSSVPVTVNTMGVLAGKTVIAIAAGGAHNLVLCLDGTVAAWGANSSGQLGNNSIVQSSVPVAVDTAGVLAGKTVVAIAAGAAHSVVLCSDGTLAAWGSNFDDELGTDPNEGFFSSHPVLVTAASAGVLSGKTVIALAAGSFHNLVLCSDGTLAAWGRYINGQLGDNNPFISGRVPRAVDTTGVLSGKTITGFSAGLYHSLALCSDGTVTAWGANAYGQLGNNRTDNSPVPALVDKSGALSGKTVVAVNAFGYHNLAQCSDGTLAAWGHNYSGELGNNSTTDSSVPIIVTTAGLAPGERILRGASGPSEYHSLGMVAAAASPRISLEQPAETRLSSGSSIVDFGTVVTGVTSDLSFAIKNSGAADLSISGVTLDGVNSDDFSVSTSPAATVGMDSSTVFVVTFRPSAVDSRSAVLHVASNDSNVGAFSITLTGTGTNTVNASYGSASAVPISANSFTASGKTVNFTIGCNINTGTSLTVINNKGRDFIQGTFTNLTQGQKVTLSSGGHTYDFVANYYGGTGNDLVLQWANVWPVAWGSSLSGQLDVELGRGGFIPTTVNSQGVLRGKTPIALATGMGHSLALCSDSTVAGWGWNHDGQLGTTLTNPSDVGERNFVPTAVNSSGVLHGKTVVALAAGERHSLALCSDGTVAAWGKNADGQLGNNNTAKSFEPVAVNTSGVLSGKTVISVAAGSNHSVALCSDGTLVAWGNGTNGQLGNSSTTSSLLPVRVDITGALSGKAVIAIACGEAHSLALCSDGTVAGWGANAYGQLGNNSVTDSPVPVSVSTAGVLAGKTVAGLAVGQYHNVVRCADGTLASWGYNSNGQLGNGSTANSSVPVAVSTTAAASGSSVVAISAGQLHSLAQFANGTVAAWGQNYWSQLGSQPGTDSSVPVAVSTASLPPDARFVSEISGPKSTHSLGIIAFASGAKLAVQDSNGTALTSGTSAFPFWRVQMGNAGSQTVVIKNIGTGSLILGYPSFEGINPAGFGLDFSTVQGPGFFVQIGTPTFPSVLPAGASFTFRVTFAPGNIGPRDAVMHIPTSAPANSSFDIPLTGEGTAETTTGAVSISSGYATLGGSVSPYAATSVFFQYGTSASYGTNTLTTNVAVGSYPTLVFQNIGGLQRGATYHYRIVVKNSDGTFYGQDQTFTTPSIADPPSWHSSQLTETADMADGSRTGVCHSSWNLYFYKGTDSHIWAVYWNGNQWLQSRLTSTPNASDWLTFVPAYGLLCYQGTDGHLWGLYWTGQAWAQAQLTSTANVAGDLTAGTAWNIVFYRGTDGHMWAVYWNGSRWVQTSLGGTANVAGSLAADNGYNLVYYRGTDNHLWCQYIAGGMWTQAKLSTTADVAGGVTADPGGLAYYRSSNYNYIWAIHWDGSSWKQSSLSSDLTMSVSDSTALYSRYNMLYISGSRRVAAEYFNGSIWGTYYPGDGGWDLTGALSMHPLTKWVFARRSDGNVVILYFR